jgi:hypothetical protein
MPLFFSFFIMQINARKSGQNGLFLLRGCYLSPWLFRQACINGFFEALGAPRGDPGEGSCSRAFKAVPIQRKSRFLDPFQEIRQYFEPITAERALGNQPLELTGVPRVAANLAIDSAVSTTRFFYVEALIETADASG